MCTGQLQCCFAQCNALVRCTQRIKWTIIHTFPPSHLLPLKPSLQTHSNNFPPCPGLHVPPFSQGLGWQGFPTAKKKKTGRNARSFNTEFTNFALNFKHSPIQVKPLPTKPCLHSQVPLTQIACSSQRSHLSAKRTRFTMSDTYVGVTVMVLIMIEKAIKWYDEHRWRFISNLIIMVIRTIVQGWATNETRYRFICLQ